MLHDIWIVYLKEMREVVRDRRTLVFMLLFPMLFMPLLAGGVSSWMEDVAKKESSATLRYAVMEPDRAPALVRALADDPGFVEVGDTDVLADVPAAIRGDRIDFVLALAGDPGGQVQAELLYENSRMMSKVEKRVAALVERVNADARDTKLEALGLATPEARGAVVTPIAVVPRGIATPREVIGEGVGGMLPYMFILFCFLGALYPATDLGAGEKERGTLETLLLAPVARTSLVLGKFFVVFTTGAVSSVLGTASFGVWLAFEGREKGGAMGEVLSTIGVGDLVSVVLLLVPVAAIIGALLLSISIYARSFKEAQSYSAPLNLLFIVPAFLAMLPGVELDWRWAMIPISNVSLGIKEVVKGSLDPALLALILASSCALAAAALAVCVRWFQRESVLFRR
jgi:sodium transport system permease protein